MPNYKNCRNAKTAEEYLLKCLFQAEEERDEAVAYCDGARKAEEERIKAEKEAQEELKEKAKNAPVFSVKETKTVKYEVASAYKFCDKDYGLADVIDQVTYRVWDGCKAPYNLEFNGRLIGEKEEPTITLAAPGGDGKHFCTNCGYLFRYKKDAETFSYCPMCGARVVRDDGK